MMRSSAQHIKSFVRRGSFTPGQKRAFQDLSLSQAFSLSVEQSLILSDIFGRDGLYLLEIGFGMGESLLSAALQFPEINFVGVETHLPGIGALLLGIEKYQLTNIRIFQGDVYHLLSTALLDNTLDGVQIFFPDPWPKRRHYARRLIQTDFIQKLLTKMKTAASLHIATDWEDYANHIREVCSKETQLISITNDRSIYRPIVSKFEKRALLAGRKITEFQFQKLKIDNLK